MAESSQSKKGRVRPPRVHIEYAVEKGGAMVMKELPFVAGVMADLAGDQERQKKLKERSFVPIDRDNFDDVLQSISPKLNLDVANRLQEDGSDLKVELNFQKLDDFHPTSVARQVAPLNELLEIRQKLTDLKGRLDGNDRLDELLNEILQNEDVRNKLKQQLGGGEGGGDAGGAGEQKQE